MDAKLIELAEWMEQQGAGPEPVTDILKRAPEVSLVDAYRIQQILMERCVVAGDRVIGYKAAFTSKGIQARFGVGEPVLGTLLESRVISEATPVAVHGYVKAILEPEVGVLLRAELSGPDFSWGGANGTNFWVDPEEQLVVVFMAHTPGPTRVHYRKVMNALVLQAVTD